LTPALLGGGGVSAGGGGSSSSSSSSSAAGAPFVLGESLLLSTSGAGLRDAGMVRSAGGMQQLQQ